MSSMAGRYWLAIFLWSVVIVLATGKEARGQTRVAGHRHLAAAMLAEDCSVFRVLAKRTASQIEETKQRLSYHLQRSQERRAELEQCARSRGLTNINDEQEAVAAEICPDAYQAWLSPGYSVQLEQEDLQDAKRGFQSLQVHMNWNCRPLPEPQSVSASVTPPID